MSPSQIENLIRLDCRGPFLGSELTLIINDHQGMGLSAARQALTGLKLSSTILRGLGDGNIPRLPGIWLKN